MDGGLFTWHSIPFIIFIASCTVILCREILLFSGKIFPAKYFFTSLVRQVMLRPGPCLPSFLSSLYLRVPSRTFAAKNKKLVGCPKGHEFSRAFFGSRSSGFSAGEKSISGGMILQC
jgi:hypothetical protein